MTATLAPAEAAAAGASAVAAVQQHELAAVLRHLGMQSLHATAVDVASLASHDAYSISEHGEVTAGLPLSLDIAFPGGSSTVAALAQAPLEHTRTQRLSPRHWLLAWRAGERTAIVAEAQFRVPRYDVSDVQAALIRYVCSASVRDAAPPPAPQGDIPDWAQSEVPAPRPRFFALLLALLLVTAGCTAWLAFVAAPQVQAAAAAQQDQLDDLRDRAKDTLAHNMSVALATSDYGEVQIALESFQELGYFEAAVVTNATHRIVAMSGTVDRQRIGDGVTPEFAQRAEVLELSLGSQVQGRLLCVGALPLAGADAPAQGVVAGAAAACACALAAAALLLLPRRRPRRDRPSGPAPAPSDAPAQAPGSFASLEPDAPRQ